MPSEVQIARLALQHLGDRYDISSLTEASPEAEQVNLVYENVRDMVLREYPWKFARKFSTPASLTGTVPGNWSYMFQYPSDCVRLIRIVNPLGDDKSPIRFEVARNGADQHVILCDLEEPQLEYTMRQTNPNEYDPQFVTAFSYRLAQYIAMPITGDRQILSDMKSLADAEIRAAQASDANEGFEAPRPSEATWIDARS
jgi:hypothetical protein